MHSIYRLTFVTLIVQGCHMGSRMVAALFLPFTFVQFIPGLLATSGHLARQSR